jgi:hypothetical protein
MNTKSLRPATVVAVGFFALLAAFPLAAQSGLTSSVDLGEDLYRPSHRATDHDGQPFFVAWPEGLSEDGFAKALQGDSISQALFLQPLTDSEHRRRLYGDLVVALATQPARNESVAVDFHGVLDELDGPAGAGLSAAERFAVAFQVASQMDLRYIRQTGALSSVVNDLKQQGRALRQLTEGRHFGYATTALQMIGVALTATNLISETVMINALATDDALGRVDEIEDALSTGQVDPELIAAFDDARDRLDKDRAWWDAFATAASRQATEITSTAVGLTSTTLSHHAAITVGGKAGALVSLWTVPIALGIAEYGQLTDTVGAIQYAMLTGYLAQRLERSASSVADYACYHFYYEMDRAMGGWLTELTGLVWSDIDQMARHYSDLEAEARALLTGREDGVVLPLPRVIPLEDLVELELDRPTEIQVGSPPGANDTVLNIAPYTWGTATVEVDAGSLHTTASHDESLMLILQPGQTVLVTPSEPTTIGFIALEAARVGSQYRETGDSAEHSAVLEGSAGFAYAMVVEGEPGGWIEVDLISGDFDAYLVGSTPDGGIVENDDGGSGHNAHLEVELDSLGRTAIIATSKERDFGRYQLLISELATNPGALQPGDRLSFGESSGFITTRSNLESGGLGVRYLLPVTAGEEITIDLESSGFDAYLDVTLPDGRDYEDDDSGAHYNSRLVITSRTSGIATVTVTSYSREETGPFTINVRGSGSQGSYGTPTGPTTGTPQVNELYLAHGSATGHGTVSTGVEYFSFELPTDDEVTITVEVTETRQGTEYNDDDSMLFLFDNQWRLVDENDDGPDGLSSDLSGLWLEEGRYFVAVTTYHNRPELDYDNRLIGFENDGASSIVFNLHVSAERASYGSLPYNDVNDFGLAIGRSIAVWPGTTRASGHVDTGHAAYRLDVRQPGLLSLEVIVTEISRGTRWEGDDSMLYLFDGGGAMLTSDDDGGASLIEGVRVTPGTYYAVVTTYPNRPIFDSSGRLEGFGEDGGSNIGFDLVVRLE